MTNETFLTTKRDVLCTLDLAALFRNDRMRLPTLRDWARVREYLDGTWPEAWPEIRLLDYAEYESFVEPYFTDWCVVDTEYDPATYRVYQIGYYAPGGLVYIWDEADPTCVPRAMAMRWIRWVFEHQRVVLQNAPADLRALGIDADEAYGVDDCVTAFSALWSEWKKNLDFMTSIHGRHVRVKHLGPGSHEYLRGDVVETANVWKAIERDFKADPLSKNVYETYLKPLAPIITDVHTRGLKVNTPVVEAKHREYTQRITDAQRLAEAYCGYPINLDSSTQLATWLTQVEDVYGDLGIKPSKTKTGRVSLSKDAVAALRDAHLPRSDDEELDLANALSRIERGSHCLLEARTFFIEARQRHSSYIKPLLNRDRTYPNFLVFAQATGRWSIIDPPLAQLPHDLRNIVRPDDGEAWIQHDWDGIEARIMAYESGDTVLIDALENDYDLHTINVCDLFGYASPPDLRNPHGSDSCDAWRASIAWEGKDDVRRVFAKRFMYRLFYGGKPEGAASIPGADLLVRFGLDKSSLIDASKTWLRKHPAITTFWKEIERDATRRNLVRTFLGRRRVLFDTDVRKRIRAAYDDPMQGGVADIMNGTVIELWRASKSIGGHLAYTMHDSVKWALPEARIDEFLPTYKAIVEREFEIRGTRVRFPATYEVRYNE